MNHKPLDLPSMVWVESYLLAFSGLVIFVSHDRSLLDRLSTETVFLSAGVAKKFSGNFSFAMTEIEKQRELNAKAMEKLDK